MLRYKLTLANGYEIEFKSLAVEDSDRFYSALMADENPYVEEFIFNSITDSKYISDGEIDLPAGIIPTVVYCCLKLSGIIKNRNEYLDAIEDARKVVANNPYMYFFSEIIRIIPRYTLSDLRAMTLNELLELFAFAERVSGTQLIDMKKAREAAKSEDNGKVSKSVRKGISAFTKEELDSLKAALQGQEQMLM